MTKHLINNTPYLNLILSTSQEQALALLHTATPDQALFISEIAKNVLQLPLPKKAQHYVNKRKSLYKQLSKKTLSKQNRLRIIRKNAKHLLTLLLSLREQLSELQ